MRFSYFVRHVLSKLLSLWPKTHFFFFFFFFNFARFCTPKRCMRVHCLVQKNNPNYVIFLRGWYPTSNNNGLLGHLRITNLRFLRRPLGKTLCQHALCVSVSQFVKLLVNAFCVVHFCFNAKTNRVRMWCVYTLWQGNIMRVALLGSKVIKGVLLDETLR